MAHRLGDLKDPFNAIDMDKGPKLRVASDQRDAFKVVRSAGSGYLGGGYSCVHGCVHVRYAGKFPRLG